MDARDQRGHDDSLESSLSSVRGGECNALAHLHDCPVDALAVPALVGDRSLQFSARILQEGECGIHAGLRSHRIADAEARNDENADQQFLLCQNETCFSPPEDMRVRTCTRRFVRRMTTSGSPTTIRFSRQILRGRSSRRSQPLLPVFPYPPAVGVWMMMASSASSTVASQPLSASMRPSLRRTVFLPTSPFSPPASPKGDTRR